MSNYNIQINWSGKDGLDDNDSDKVISGSDFNTEYTAVKTAVNSKADLNGDAGEAWSCNALTASTTSTVNGKTIAVLDLNQDFVKAQRTAPTTVTLSSNQTADLTTSNVFIVDVQGSFTLTTSGMATGGCYTFVIKNTGAFDIDFSNQFYFYGGDPTITSGASKYDLISCVSDGTNLYCSINYDLEAS